MANRSSPAEEYIARVVRLRWRRSVTTAVMFAAAGFASVGWMGGIFNFGLSPQLADAMLVGGGAIVAASAAFQLYTYLEQGYRTRVEVPAEKRVEDTIAFLMQRAFETDEKFEHLQRANSTAIDRLEEEVRQAASLSADKLLPDKKKLASEVSHLVFSAAGTEGLAELRRQAAQAYSRESGAEILDNSTRNSRERLGREIASLSRRGNVNLVLGGFFTLLGLGLLAAFVWQSPGVSKGMVELLGHFLPRLTLVVFIQVFAYFFLKLYKVSLEDIKYFQNELTNHEAQSLALRVAMHSQAPDLVAEMSRAIVATERNHVLNKGQTTVEIEKARLSQSEKASLVTALTALLGKKE